MNKVKFFWLTLLIPALLTSACGSSYSNPAFEFDELHLVGTWESRYSGQRRDTLIIRPDGTFKQIYKDNTLDEYVFETPWNEWWVERFPDGRARLHLEGARFYVEGTSIGERDGLSPLCPEDQPDCRGSLDPPPHGFYDPISEGLVQMVDELILNVQTESSGFVLLHMKLSGDQGWLSLTGKARGFSRVETP